MKTTRNFLLVLVVGAMLACAAAFAFLPDISAPAAALGIQPTDLQLSLLAFSAIGMTTFTETLPHAGGYIISEAMGTRSRDIVTLASGNNLIAGTVLGKISMAGATAAAVAGNTGTGTVGAIVVGAGAKPGVYTLTIIEPGANAGAFTVEDPDGIIIGHGTVAVAFSAGGLGFTLSDATDFIAGDQILITVAAGSAKYGALDLSSVTGLAAAVAVLYDDVDATAADKPAVINSRDCEVASAKLTWPAGASAPQKAAALAQLAALGIIAR